MNKEKIDPSYLKGMVFSLRKQLKLSSKHFISDCYDVNPWSTQKKLINDAVPRNYLQTQNINIISNNITNGSLQ